MTNESHGWSEPEATEFRELKAAGCKLEAAEFRELKAAGWEPEEGAGGVIWRNPFDSHWYDDLMALAIIKGDEDPAD
jgi:hypothetical protein